MYHVFNWGLLAQELPINRTFPPPLYLHVQLVDRQVVLLAVPIKVAIMLVRPSGHHPEAIRRERRVDLLQSGAGVCRPVQLPSAPKYIGRGVRHVEEPPSVVRSGS